MPAPAKGSYVTKLPEGQDLVHPVKAPSNLLFLTPVEAAEMFMRLDNPMMDWVNTYYKYFHNIFEWKNGSMGGAEIRKVRHVNPEN